MLWFRSLFLDQDGAPGGGDSAPPAAPAAREGDDRPPMTSAERLRESMQNVRSHLSPDGTTLRREVPAGEQPPAEGGNKPPAKPAERTDDGRFAPTGRIREDGSQIQPGDDDYDEELDGPGAEPPEGDEPPEGEEDERLRVVLRPRSPGEQPRVIYADTPEAAEDLRRTVKEGLRRDEFNRLSARVERQAEELQVVEDLIRLDPAGFVLEHMPQESQQEVALAVLAQPGMLEAVLDLVDGWRDNPDQRERDRLTRELDRTRKREEIDRQLNERHASRAIVREVTRAADDMAELIDPNLQQQFVDDLLGDMQAFARANPRVGRLTVEQMVQHVWGRRLSLYGVDPKDAVEAAKSGGVLPTRGKPKGEAARKLAAQAAEARKTGPKFRSSSTARRAAAATPSAGSGVTPPADGMPKHNWQERSSWLRQKFNLPQRKA